MVRPTPFGENNRFLLQPFTRVVTTKDATEDPPHEIVYFWFVVAPVGLAAGPNPAPHQFVAAPSPMALPEPVEHELV